MGGEDAVQLLDVAPVLDEMLAILDASRTVNGEIQMDYARFTFLLQEARSRLGRLGIQLPNLNEGGDGAIFHQTLRRVADRARSGDVAGARWAQRPGEGTVVQSSPKSFNDWVAVLGISALGLAIAAVLILIAAHILWSAGEWVVDTVSAPTPVPTPRYISPDSCYGLSTDECRGIWFDKLTEDDMRWQAAEYERLIEAER